MPQVQYIGKGKVNDRVEFSYPPTPQWSIPLIASYAVSTADSVISASHFEEVQSLKDLRKYAKGAHIGTTLADSVLCHEQWMAFYIVFHSAICRYHSGLGISLAAGLMQTVRDSLYTLASWTAELRYS